MKDVLKMLVNVMRSARSPGAKARENGHSSCKDELQGTRPELKSEVFARFHRPLA